MANESNPITGGQLDPMAGKMVGQESSLSNWAGPYVTEMLGRGKALADMPYTAYTGPLTAGASNLQQKAFQGLANLVVPTAQQTSFTPGSFTAEGMANKYMNPYVSNALNPVMDEMRRQAEISKEQTRSELAKAGAYGGSRQAIMESEINRNLQDQLARVLGQGYMDAYNQAASQFNTEQQMGLSATQQAQQYGLAALGAQQQAGDIQRAIEQEGVSADLAQFEQERMYPYKQVQFMQSLLQGLPLGAQSFNYQAPSDFSTFMSSTGGIMDLLDKLGG